MHVNGVDVVDPAGHWYPAEHGPLHVPDDWRLSDPKNPALQGVSSPPKQYDPTEHGSTDENVVSDAPTPRYPGLMFVGDPDLAGHTFCSPHSFSVALVDPVGQ